MERYDVEKVQNGPLLASGVVEVPQGMASLPLSTERATAASHKANCGASQRPSLLLDARGLCDQELNERTKERFTPLVHVVCKLEKPKYSGSFSWDIPRCGRSQLRKSDELQSMDGSLRPPLLQNPACAFAHTRLLSHVPVVSSTLPVVRTTGRACDLGFGAFPTRGYRSHTLQRGSRASPAFLPPSTYT